MGIDAEYPFENIEEELLYYRDSEQRSREGLRPLKRLQYKKRKDGIQVLLKMAVGDKSFYQDWLQYKRAYKRGVLTTKH